MKAITHAQKALMVQYFEVLEAELRRALKEAAAGTPSDTRLTEIVAGRVRGRIAGIAARIPGSSAPSLQQIRKNLEAVLDPAFSTDANGDPIKAVRVLSQQLRQQPEYTRPKGGVWNHAQPPRRNKPR